MRKKKSNTIMRILGLMMGTDHAKKQVSWNKR